MLNELGTQHGLTFDSDRDKQQGSILRSSILNLSRMTSTTYLLGAHKYKKYVLHVSVCLTAP